MSLLKALLSAMARGQIKPQNVIPKPPQAPVLVQRGAQPPSNRAVQAVYDGDLNGFLALPPADQLVAIEAELATLLADQQRLIIDTLRPELKRKWLPLPRPQSMALQSDADILDALPEPLRSIVRDGNFMAHHSTERKPLSR